MGKTALHFDDVWKQFRLGETHDSLRDLLASALHRLSRRNTRRDDASTFWALKDLDFDIAHGEAVGVIGPNGAGKSTVLKLMAGILRPNRGQVGVTGRLAALIEVGAGFHGDLSGRENIMLNGAIMGMRREEIRRKLDDIVAFAGLDRFLDMPVKRYSSGMYARLGFSIAAHVDPEILIVDEVLSVGDAVFRLRCEERMRELVRGGSTLIFVTHNLEQMQSICQRAIVLESGSRTFDGPARDAVGHYMKAMSHSYRALPADMASDEQDTGAGTELVSVRLLDSAGTEAVWIRPRQALYAEVTFRLPRPIPRLTLELAARQSTDRNVLCFNSARDGRLLDGREGVNMATLAIPTVPLAGGRYFWNVRLWDSDRGTIELDTPFRFPMVIEDADRATGMLSLEHEWRMEQPTIVKTSCAAGPLLADGAPETAGSGVPREGLRT